MTQSLVIVESPAKAKTIEKYLGKKNYKVVASMGHVRDLPKSQIGIDIENNYQPKYITIRGKGKLIDALKKDAKKADKIYLATDPDREGEAISWHLSTILGLDADDKCRIEFHEITKTAIKDAIKKPRQINRSLVDAQQARRVLDRLVGYEISPILWRKIKWGLSAGRVQSVTVRLICDRENEIKAFVPEEYWSLSGLFQKNSSQFEGKLYGYKDKKISLTNKEQIDNILKELKGVDYVVRDVKHQEKRKNPTPPFTTSTLQQEAHRKVNFTTKKTMSVAQQLYEGIDIKGEGSMGLITYMRTDSVRISEEAEKAAAEYIERVYGKDFLPETKKIYKTKGNAQEAHEAIRPTSVDKNPEEIKDSLSQDQYKLYKLIWTRFVASQMKEAVYSTVSVDIKAKDYNFRANGSILKFAGFLSVYKIEEEEEEEESKLPELKPEEKLKLNGLEPKQHFTQPPPRYTEASLVRALEENGIGRPSTYAPIISTIIDRGYIERDKKNLFPTELGEVVTDLLKDYFKDIVDADFTAGMERKLDEIEAGNDNWIRVVAEFFSPISDQIKIAEDQIGKITLNEPVEETDIPCDKCGKLMIIKKGRFGKFLACPGYPDCKNTKPLVEELDVECPKCGGKIVVRKSKKGRIFFGCKNYPNCDFVSWNKPLAEKCPECSGVLIEKNLKNKKEIKCTNENCTYKRIEE